MVCSLVFAKQSLYTLRENIMTDYVIKKAQIDALPGLYKTHFLNENAQRNNKSLGDLTGITGFGFHLIEVPPGKESTEFHVHYFEDECTYVLSGTGKVLIGEKEHEIAAGDFIGYRKNGEPHTMINNSTDALVCIVVGERLAHDVGDYPAKQKRIYRNNIPECGLVTNVVEHKYISEPSVGPNVVPDSAQTD